jgi:biotin-dependent carboxylase-like uncharacterized protein
MRRLEVVRAGVLTTVQDLGRVGLAHLGVPRSGAVDAGALKLANRLVGNPEETAGLEVTLGGCLLRPAHAATIAVTGAVCDVHVDQRAVDWGLPTPVPAGATVRIGRASAGLRAYVAIDGGVAVAPVLGSRATDTLSGIGPPPIRDGDVLPVGQRTHLPPGVDAVPYVAAAQDVTVDLSLGPRADWFTADAIETLGTETYTVSMSTDRVGARLIGPALTRAVAGELPSEGVVLGAVQVPADGQPLIFLADHPTTGGYPVVGVLSRPGVEAIGQARPGTPVRFRILG